jgi:hypothetical protein
LVKNFHKGKLQIKFSRKVRQPKITFFCGGEGKCLYYNSLLFNEKNVNIMIVVASFLHSVLICVRTKMKKENRMSSRMYCDV